MKKRKKHALAQAKRAKQQAEAVHYAQMRLSGTTFITQAEINRLRKRVLSYDFEK